MTQNNVDRSYSSIILFSLWALFTSTISSAMSLNELENSGNLRIQVMLNPSDEVVVFQETTLTIDIQTTGWFTQGTEIKLPELQNAIIMQRENFATNSTQKEGRKTWVSQRWELSVFPISEGALSIPEIVLSLSINSPEHGIINGEINTLAQSIQATTPVEMAGIKNWITASDLTIDQSFNKALENLKVGDAFKQVVVMKGENTLAMMLPSYSPANITGLAAYPKQATLRDNNTRGSKQGERIEVINYIVEAEGRYILPEVKFHYWNTITNSYENVLVPATDILVGEDVVVTNIDKSSEPQTYSNPLNAERAKVAIVSILSFALVLSLIHI